MIKPKFLFNNVLKGVTPSWSGTSILGKTPANATDWTDYSYFEADSGNLDYTMGASTPIDSVSIYVANFTGTGANTITLQYESSPSVYTNLQTINPVGGKLTFDEFSGVTVASGRKIRLVVSVGTGSILIRQLVVGEAMEAEQGQFVSMTYPSLLGGIKTTNSIAMNGSVLGRSIQRLERSGSLELENLTAAWVRSTWETFSRHAAKYPFIYKPNPRDYATEVAFSVVEKSISPPANMAGRGDRMSVKWKLRHLVADEFAL